MGDPWYVLVVVVSIVVVISIVVVVDIIGKAETGRLECALEGRYDDELGREG